MTEERSVLSLRIRAASVRGKGSRRKRPPEEDLELIQGRVERARLKQKDASSER